jgi:hypothetical protein
MGLSQVTGHAKPLVHLFLSISSLQKCEHVNPGSHIHPCIARGICSKHSNSYFSENCCKMYLDTPYYLLMETENYALLGYYVVVVVFPYRRFGTTYRSHLVLRGGSFNSHLTGDFECNLGCYNVVPLPPT